MSKVFENCYSRNHITTMKKPLFTLVFLHFCLLWGTNTAFSQNVALGPGLSIVNQLNDNLGIGTMLGINFSGKYFSPKLPLAAGGYLSINGRSFNEVNRFQVYRAGAEINIFLKKETKFRTYLGTGLGVLASYRDDTPLPLINFYLDINPRFGGILTLSENTWLDVFVGVGFGFNDMSSFISLPIGVSLIYDTFKEKIQ